MGGLYCAVRTALPQTRVSAQTSSDEVEGLKSLWHAIGAFRICAVCLGIT